MHWDRHESNTYRFHFIFKNFSFKERHEQFIVVLGNHNNANMNRNEDIDSKIADFMAVCALHSSPSYFSIKLFLFWKDIDEIVGKKSTTDHNRHQHQDGEQSEWKECFDETSQSVYYWNTVTNECSWDPPPPPTQNHLTEKSIK